MAFIYALVDPRDNTIRYVGKTNNPRLRLASHCCLTSSHNTYLIRWVAKLKREGLRAGMFILDEIPESIPWQRYERAWIASFGKRRPALANRCPGGNGPGEVSRETRAKMSKASKGKPKSQSHRKAIADGLRGKPKTIVHREHLVLSHWSRRGGHPWNRLEDEVLLDRIRTRTRELGRVPKTREMGSYAWITITRRFGSWRQACALAMQKEKE